MTVADELHGNDDLLLLCRRLGELCLDAERDIAAARARDASIDEVWRRLAQATAQVATRQDPGTGRTLVGDLLASPAVQSRVALLEEEPCSAAFASLGVLYGLCQGPLTRHYEETDGRLTLARGDPHPLPARPKPGNFEDLTPHHTTIDATELLAGSHFRLWRRPASEAVGVCLDYTFRDELDATLCPERAGDPLPRVAVVSPYAELGELEVTERHDRWWFGVRPRAFDEQAVLDDLAWTVGDDVAVLPELSLPEPGSLARGLARAPERFAPLVVAGSAHVRYGSAPEIRANESRTYLRGVLLLVHRKIHPFSAKRDQQDGSTAPWPEGLTPEPKTLTVACGTKARLAVLICADLNDLTEPDRLTEAAVNHLFVPALTPRLGAFGGAAAPLASRCQGCVVIANGATDAEAGGATPFAVFAAVPREDPEHQSRAWAPPSSGRRAIARVDLDQPLPDTPDWQPL